MFLRTCKPWLTSWAIFNQNHPILTQKVVNFRDFCLNFCKSVNFGPLWKPLVKTPKYKIRFQNVFSTTWGIKKSPWIKDFFNFWYYSNSILYTFKSIQHIHYMVIYTITFCIIYIPNLLRIFCTHFGVTVSTYWVQTFSF